MCTVICHICYPGGCSADDGVATINKKNILLGKYYTIVGNHNSV